MLELYHNNLSVCAQKVRIVLAEKGVPWTSRYVRLVDGEQLTPEFKRINPRGLVPVLVHDGHAIIESSVICAYLDDVFSDPPLVPRNLIDRARMRLWCKLPDDSLHVACGTVSFAITFARQLAQRAGAGLEQRLARMPDPARRERQRALIEKGIETTYFGDHIKIYDKAVADMEEQLASTSWLACETYTLADAELTPYIERADRLGLAGLWTDRPRVAAWFDRVRSRASFKAITDYPPTDYDDTGRDGLVLWPRIEEIIASA